MVTEFDRVVGRMGSTYEYSVMIESLDEETIRMIDRLDKVDGIDDIIKMYDQVGKIAQRLGDESSVVAGFMNAIYRLVERSGLLQALIESRIN